jgi:membrane protease YdiL (CAAX protease family)
MIEVVCVFLGMALALGFCFTLAIFIAHHVPGLRGLRPAELTSDPRVILPAQLAAYLMVFGALWRLFAHHLHIGFLRALSWQWPSRWHMFVAGGVLLAVAVQVGSHLLPAPPELPIEKMFRSASDAWMMSIFGVFVAPFVEEVLFRGLLFPALARRAGVLLSLVVTSLLFGAMHATQLGGAWIQVSCIVFVGVVLTVVRWRYRSLACSTLVHVGYNGLLFTALFVQTRGFTQFPLR